MNDRRWNAVLGLACVGFALLTLWWWIPEQIDSGVVEQVRRQVVIGDAMAPTIWAIGIGLLGAMLAVQGLAGARDAAPKEGTGGPTASNLLHLAIVIAIVTLGLWVMTAAGPAVVKLAQLFGSGVESYREVRGTRPWKYVGYLLGGFLMTLGLMSFITRRVTWTLAVIAAVAVLAMALAYDLPFKNLLLPPNGDQ